MKFAKTLFVVWEELDEPYMVAQENMDGLDPVVGEVRRVGVYRLERVDAVRVERKVVVTPGRKS